MPDPAAEFGFGTPWQAQLEFFRAKLNLPTERWDDVMRAAHDRAFVVAGAAKADLLHDLRGAVDRALQTSDLAAFRRDFDQVVARHGWTGWTGEGSAAGRAWRTRVIFQTNLASSYAAGRWQQMNDPKVAAVRPYWRYVHADGVLHPRPHHLAWDGTTLPREHAFWKTHFAPNGWGCRCEIWPVKAPAADAKTEPPQGWDTRSEATGEPPGIDRGWGYAPGAERTTPLAQLVERKLLALDAPIGAAMAQALEPAIAMERRLAWTEMVDRIARTHQPDGSTALATAVAPRVVTRLREDHGVVLDSAGVWLSDHVLAHALRSSKAARSAAVPAAVWRDLPRLLQTAEAYWDTQDAALLYVVTVRDDARLGKFVVYVNHNIRGRFDGERDRRLVNAIRTGGLVQPSDLAPPRYVRL